MAGAALFNLQGNGHAAVIETNMISNRLNLIFILLFILYEISIKLQLNCDVHLIEMIVNVLSVNVCKQQKCNRIEIKDNIVIMHYSDIEAQNCLVL